VDLIESHLFTVRRGLTTGYTISEYQSAGNPQLG